MIADLLSRTVHPFCRQITTSFYLMKNNLRILIFLVTLLGAQFAGAATLFRWNVAAPGANNWNVSGNWSPNGVAGVADTNVFGNVGLTNGPTTPNNVVSATVTISTLSYTNFNTAGTSNHVTQIPSGVTLTVSSNLNVSGLGAVDAQLTSVAMVDAGTLAVNAVTLNVANNGSAASSALATLDLSGLTNFVYNNSGGSINVANNGVNRAGGLLILAGVSNNITAANLNLFTQNLGNGGNGASGIKFGSGTNILNIGTITLVQGKNAATVQFNTVSGGLRIRGVTGASDDSNRATLILGSRNSTGTGLTAGNLSLNGHPLDVKVGTLTLGADSQTGGNSALGTISFNSGTFDVTTLNMATLGNAAVIASTGTVSVASGTLIANTISLVNQSTAAAGAGGIGTLIVTNAGLVICSNGITKATSSGTGTITLSSAALTMLGGTVGTLATPVNVLNITNSTLTLALGSATNISVTTLNMDSPNSILNVSSFPAITGYPTTLPVIKYTTLNGNFALDAGSLGAYQGYVTTNLAAGTIDLVLNGVLPRNNETER